LSPPPPSSLAAIKLVNPGLRGKMAIKMERERERERDEGADIICLAEIIIIQY